MQEIMILASVVAPIVLALTEVVKKAVTLPKNIIPLIALVIGINVGVLSTPFTDLDFQVRMWAGAIAGLSATGLFELVNPRSGVTKEEK